MHVLRFKYQVANHAGRASHVKIGKSANTTHAIDGTQYIQSATDTDATFCNDSVFYKHNTKLSNRVYNKQFSAAKFNLILHR